MRLLLSLLILAASFMPLTTFAAETSFFGPIFPPECNCTNVEGPDGTVLDTAPDWGCVLETVRRIINFALSIGVIVFVLVVIYAGILFMASPLKAENRELGRSIIMNAFIGMLIALSAWVLIDFVMKTVYRGGEGTELGPWNSILQGGNACLLPRAQPTAAPSVPNTTTGPGTVTVSGACPGNACVALEPEVNCEASGCQVASSLKEALENIGMLSSWTVTEAYPASRTHRAACHQNGTCVDIAFRPPTYNALPDGNVKQFVTAAQGAGLRVVFEVAEGGPGPCPKRDAARVQGITAYCRSDGGGYQNISGTHFSVYAN